MKLLKLAPVSLGLLDVASAAVDHFLPAKEFAAILKPKVAARDLVYSKAISILEAMDDSPSCARVATDNLIGDCQALNAPDAASVKQTYSMRLAMCELKEGGKWPRQCKVFLPTREGCTENCFVSPTPRQTKDCLQKLGETPQFWTSFSNAGHGAVAVCEASRWENRQAEMERAMLDTFRESKDLYKGLMNDLESVLDALAKANEMAAEQVTAERDETRTDFLQATALVGRELNDFVNFVQSGLMNTGTEVNGLSTRILTADRHAASLMDTLIKLSGVAEGINDLEGALKGLDKSVHGVQGTVSTMGASLTGLFDTFEQRQGTMAAVWAQQDSINARFESASNNVDMVRVKLNAMYDEVPALTEDLRD